MKHWLLLCCLGFALLGCSQQEPWLSPSGHSALIPDRSLPFDHYVEQSHQRLLLAMESMEKSGLHVGFIGGYNAQQAAAMRAPFEWRGNPATCSPARAALVSDSAFVSASSERTPIAEEDGVEAVKTVTLTRTQGFGKGNGKGFLLIHGLTDSPYSLRSMAESLKQAYPCALIRAVLLPGHGTWPGDSLKMSHEEWQRIVDYGVNSFQDEDVITELYMVGFSTGTSLTIDYLSRHPEKAVEARKDKIKGAVMMATAVKANSSVAFMAPWVRHVTTWMSHHKEQDAIRYESFSYHAAAEFYLLTEDMMQREKALTIPVMMVVPADDTTVDTRAAREFFCYASQIERKLLLWYTSVDERINQKVSANPALNCDHIVEVAPSNMDAAYQTLNQSHLGVLIPPSDSHYGLNGKYRHCKYYESNGTEEEFQACQKDDQVSVFGENYDLLKEQGKLDGRYLRRGTFNPEYDAMMEKVICFVNERCELKTVLQAGMAEHREG